jgi:hypothetical protein
MTTLRAAILHADRVQPSRVALSEPRESNGPGRSESKGPCDIVWSMYYVYILRTSSNTLYVGVTENLRRRISTHNSGKRSEWIKVHPDAQLGREY